MHIRLSSAAKADLRAIKAYFSKDNPNAATTTLRKILRSISFLETFPLLGHPGRVKDTRELVIPRARYFVVYTLPDAYHVDVERVLHGARNYPWA